MPRFTTRVELHNATSYETYERLHAEMEARGFSRTIASGDGTAYHLPSAEYNFEGNLTRNEVLELAKAGSARVDRSFAVLVTESAGRVWDGLTAA